MESNHDHHSLEQHAIVQFLLRFSVAVVVAVFVSGVGKATAKQQLNGVGFLLCLQPQITVNDKDVWESTIKEITFLESARFLGKLSAARLVRFSALTAFLSPSSRWSEQQ